MIRTLAFPFAAKAGTNLATGSLNCNFPSSTSCSAGTQTIGGTGTLMKVGSGAVTLAGSSGNTYSGLTTVSDGTLALNKASGNAVGGIINAARSNVPVLFSAGRNPITESGHAGSRDRPIHWAQESFDQAAMVREFVKWDYELRTLSHLETVVDRALAITQSEPQGPVYLTLPREVLAERMDVPANLPFTPEEIAANAQAAGEIAAEAAQGGIRVAQWSPTRVRMVTHLDVTRAQCAQAAAVLVALLAH